MTSRQVDMSREDRTALLERVRAELPKLRKHFAASSGNLNDEATKVVVTADGVDLASLASWAKRSYGPHVIIERNTFRPNS